jgi:NADH-quinone oxidoreductase subunit L
MADFPWIIPLLPLVAFAINGAFGPRYLKKATGYIGSAGILGAFAATVALWAEGVHAETPDFTLYRWVSSGSFTIDIGFVLDPLTVVMLLVVTGVSFLVHVYSIGYMAHDESFARFFTWLPLFVFAMIMLVLSNNFLSLYVFWELVGVCSYLLIGFWHQRKSATDAAVKAFLVNRIGDFGFAIGIILIFWNFGSLNYGEVFAAVPDESTDLMLIIALLLFVGAMGKSAQFPLHIWLPDAMEGPTPVSALIHAATMVTAGVYMVARMRPIFEMSGEALLIVGGIGAFTALFAASIGLAQTDIKRVLAYSTVSQLGLMFLALGAGAYTVAIFHLATHAFFKALLFLGSGSVIHAMQDQQEMSEYGGLWRRMKWTYFTFLLGGLALSGVFPLAGFWSKDEALAGAFFKGVAAGGSWPFTVFWIMGLIASLFTAIYTFRMIILTFHGRPRNAELHSHAHESPAVMVAPLVVLAIGAVALGGAIGFPPEDGFIHSYLHDIPGVFHFAGAGELTALISLATISTAIAAIGIVVAYAIYSRREPSAESVAALSPSIYTLLYRKYFVDEIVSFGIVGVTKGLGLVLWAIDAKIVDGIVNLIGWIVRATSSLTRRVQTGQVQNYLFLVAAGAVVSVGAFVIFR